MPSPPRFSIWLVPSPTQRETLSALIGDLAARYGAVHFSPHVTIVGDYAMPSEAAALAQFEAVAAFFTAPLSVPIVGAEQSPAHFRSVYALCDASHAALLALHGACAGRLAAETTLHPGAFMPHLSLAYGVTPEARRVDACAEVRGLLAEIGALDLVALQLWDTSLDCARWRLLASVELAD